MTAETNLVFATVARYLYAHGWYQDGDDPGLWRNDEAGDFGDGAQDSLGGALETQLERDGFAAWEFRPK